MALKKLPDCMIQDPLPFVPRLVITPAISQVIDEVVRQWRHREQFAALQRFGIRPLDRVLFHGPPGNGKTLTSYAIGHRLRLPVFRVLCNQLHGRCLGETTKAVADLLDYLQGTTEPAICLFDEVDSIFVNRQVSSGQCDREIAAAMTIFMQALDRWRAPTLLILCTNVRHQIDEALLSRVEAQIEFGGPTAEQAASLIDYWAELLQESGGGEWGPPLKERLADRTPESFRAIQQLVARTARAWVAARLDK